MSVKRAKQVTETKCDYCNQSKGRNAKIVHQLKFSDADALRSHLLTVYPKSDYDSGWIDSEIKWFNFVHRYYYQESRDKYQPIWLSYLESQGVTVKNRSEAIIKFRSPEENEQIPF